MHVAQENMDEYDTRQRLAQAMADGNIADPSERMAIIGQTVVAWRAANRGKPLPKFSAQSAPAAWKSLLDQMYMLAGEGVNRVTEVGEFVRQLGLSPLRLVLSGGAKLVVYAAPTPDECDDRLQPHAWVHRITIERGKTKYLEKARKWALLPQQAASETCLYQWECAGDWASRVSVFPSYERKSEVMAVASQFFDALKPFTATMTEVDHQGHLANWQRVRDQANAKSKYVQHPVLAVPFGVIYYSRTKEVEFLCVGVRNAHSVLASLAPPWRCTPPCAFGLHQAFWRYVKGSSAL